MFKDLASQVISLHKQKAFSWNNDYLMVLMVPCWKAYLRRGVKKSARRKQRRGHQGLVLMKHEQHAYIQVYNIYILLYINYIYTGQIIIVETNEIERLQAAKKQLVTSIKQIVSKKKLKKHGNNTHRRTGTLILPRPLMPSSLDTQTKSSDRKLCKAESWLILIW